MTLLVNYKSNNLSRDTEITISTINVVFVAGLRRCLDDRVGMG
jgi:hypothetical protein